MKRLLIFSLSACLSALTCAPCPAKNKTPPSPISLSKQLKQQLEPAYKATVSVNINGSGSGVIISEDGLVLTAAHMMRKLKGKDPVKPISIILSDGRKAEAKLLGFNRESDFALLQITSPSDTRWPHCPLANKAPLTGEFCFTLGHPSGYLKGRPTQVRLGRITSHSTRNQDSYYLFADCNIQPGDSGGPLFSMQGELIGINSSAAKQLGINIYPAIDQFHADRKRLLAGERWGDVSLAPDGAESRSTKMTPEALNAIQQELMRRYQLKYPPTVDWMHSLVTAQGEVKITPQTMIKHMTREAIALSKNQPISFGLDAPEIVAQLPQLTQQAPAAIAMKVDGKRVAYGIALDSSHLLTKASVFDPGQVVTARVATTTAELECVARNPEWDLAIWAVKGDGSVKLPALVWPKAPPEVQPGDLLISRDAKGRPLWNVATDQSREVRKKRSIGPIEDPSIISKHRAPYPTAVRHALPLTAKDVGAPVFNQSGQWVGIHIARFSRTMGMMIPVDILKQQATQMLRDLP